MNKFETMTKIYAFDFSNLGNELSVLSYSEYLTPKEKRIAEEKKNALIRKQYIFSRLLLKYAVLENDFEYSEIIKNEKGKPYFKKAEKNKNNLPFFSISHSGGFVCVAISDKEVGVDIQKEKIISQAVLDKFFSKKELCYIKNDELSASAIWSIKESVFKYDGTGIISDINSSNVLLEDGQLSIENRDNLYIKSIHKNNYNISVCSEDADVKFVFLNSGKFLQFYI